jgi:hypothetical protein
VASASSRCFEDHWEDANATLFDGYLGFSLPWPIIRKPGSRRAQRTAKKQLRS